MRNTILFIIFLIFSFLINVIFYYISADYRFFLKNLKKNELTIEEQSDFLNDNFSYTDKQKVEITEENQDIVWQDLQESESQDMKLDENIEIVKTSDENNLVFSDEKDNKVKIKSNVSLWKNYKEILDIFYDYDLQALELNTNLFDITNEYPDNYLEYYSKELTLYFFPTKTYKEVYDIFSVLEFELPFKMNAANTFWEESFFVNLNQDISDNFVRVVISHKWVVFWLKIKKNEYNLIKEKLNTLRTN